VKRLAISVAVILATLLGLYLLWEFRDAVLLFFFSLAVAAAVRPLVSYWEGKGLSHTLALTIIYGVGLAIIGALIYFVGGALLDEVERGGNFFVSTYDQLWATWPQGSTLQQTVVQWLPPPDQLYQSLAGAQLTTVLSQFLGVTLSTIEFVSQVVVVLMLSLYWGMDRVRFERLWLSLLPATQRAQARDLWHEVETAVGGYLRSEVVASLVGGLLLGAGYWAMGLPFPALLALAGVLARLIPWLGILFALTPILLVTLPMGPIAALVASLYTVFVFILLIDLVELRLIRRGYSTLLIVLVMIALADLYGLAGLVFAPPLAVAIQVFFNHFTSAAVEASIESNAVASQVYRLQERLAGLRLRLGEADGTPLPQTAHLTQRLTQLVERARVDLHIPEPKPEVEVESVKIDL